MADVPWITEKTGQPTGRLLPPQTHFRHGYNDSSQKPGRGSVNTGIQSPFTCFFFFFSWSFPSTHPEPHGMLSSWCFTDFCTQSCPNSPDFWSQCRYGLLLQWKPVKSALDEKAALKEGKWTSSAGGKVSNRGSSLLLALQWVRLFILPTTSIYLVCTAVPRNPWVHFPWFHLPAVNHIPKILNENYQK